MPVTAEPTLQQAQFTSFFLLTDTWVVSSLCLNKAAMGQSFRGDAFLFPSYGKSADLQERWTKKQGKNVNTEYGTENDMVSIKLQSTLGMLSYHIVVKKEQAPPLPGPTSFHPDNTQPHLGLDENSQLMECQFCGTHFALPFEFFGLFSHQ
ncbi:hypothetical protein STEG23_011970, partial [Scotinomys teguina]